ncbi:OCIA domain-containing protein 1 [Anabrus simplex]|uniref:OCIA domain-containing protein 1 n=1 Tax=Anabrus simplex TaxID=316456 RepID=UPI0034DD2888
MAADVDSRMYGAGALEDPSAPSVPQKRMSQTPQTPYRFNNDELRVLRQCNVESFYQRCLPLGTLLGLGAYFGVKSGYLRPSPRFGPSPKVFVGVTLGYFIGKFSYQSKCAEKLMHLPNSPLGEMLRMRKKKGGGFQDTLSLDSGFSSLPSFSNMNSLDTYSDVAPIHDLDLDRPMNEGLDDSFRPAFDTPVLEEEILPPSGTPTPPTTYEELRRKNREEYEQKKTKQYRGVTGQDDVPSLIRQRPPQDSVPQPPASWSKEKNKYGDVWEE